MINLLITVGNGKFVSNASVSLAVLRASCPQTTLKLNQVRVECGGKMPPRQPPERQRYINW